MIKIKNINGSPETVPDGAFYAVHNDGDFFHYFQNEQEKIDFMESLPKPSIEVYKKEATDKIDAKTQELIFKGFDFDGCHWSLSITAQINWSNIPNLPEQFFPLPMQDQNGVNYQLTYANRMSFYLTAVGAKNTHLQSGNALCSQVESLTTIEDVLNFVDPR